MEGNLLRVDNLAHAALEQLNAHQNNQHGHNQPGDVLHPTVAEGVVPVRLLRRQMEAEEGYHRGAGVAEVVQRVAGDGDGAAEKAGKELQAAQQHVQRNAHQTAEHPAAPAYFGVLGIGVARNKAAGQ